MTNKQSLKLDAEEQVLLESFERGEWRSIKNLEQEIKNTKQIAKNTLHKYAAGHPDNR